MCTFLFTNPWFQGQIEAMFHLFEFFSWSRAATGATLNKLSKHNICLLKQRGEPGASKMWVCRAPSKDAALKFLHEVFDTAQQYQLGPELDLAELQALEKFLGKGTKWQKTFRIGPDFPGYRFSGGPVQATLGKMRRAAVEKLLKRSVKNQASLKAEFDDHPALAALKQLRLDFLRCAKDSKADDERFGQWHNAVNRVEQVLADLGHPCPE